MLAPHPDRKWQVRSFSFAAFLNIIYPYTITPLKHRCTKGLRYGICLLNMYHRYTIMVYVMVYVAQTYTVAEILCASRFQHIYGIWVHVFQNFFGNSLWLVIPSFAYSCASCINLHACTPSLL